MLQVKRGDDVVKLMVIGGIETAAIATVTAVDKKRGLFSTGDVRKPSDIEADGVCTYSLSDGRAVVNYIPGCSSRIVLLGD